MGHGYISRCLGILLRNTRSMKAQGWNPRTCPPSCMEILENHSWSSSVLRSFPGVPGNCTWVVKLFLTRPQRRLLYLQTDSCLQAGAAGTCLSRSWEEDCLPVSHPMGRCESHLHVACLGQAGQGLSHASLFVHLCQLLCKLLLLTTAYFWGERSRQQVESPRSPTASPLGLVGGSALQLPRCFHGLEAPPQSLIHYANTRPSMTEKGPDKGLTHVAQGNKVDTEDWSPSVPITWRQRENSCNMATSWHFLIYRSIAKAFPSLFLFPVSPVPPLVLGKVLESLRFSRSLPLSSWYLCGGDCVQLSYSYSSLGDGLAPGEETCMPAVIPAQVKAKPSRALPAREEKKASLWGGKHVGWVDSLCTRCEFHHFTVGGSIGDKKREKEIPAMLRKVLWLL